MTALGIFHVTAYADDGPDPTTADRVRIVAGTCTTGKRDAAAQVTARLERDGYRAVTVHDCERVTYSASGWPAYGVLIYS